ncbi:hypothetical protein [Viscerimonas tarda]
MKESVFMQMHNGKRTGEGSFNVALKELFYKADMKNRCKLVKAFPEFFGYELPEFGIVEKHTRMDGAICQTIIGNGNIQIAGIVNKTFKYKGWLCEWDGITEEYNVYTPDELEQPKGYRQAEYECSTKEQCKQFIDGY